jgi:hypothetical protein
MKLINNVLFLFVLVSLVNSISCQSPTKVATGFTLDQQYVADNNQSTPGSDGKTAVISDDPDDYYNNNRYGTENPDGSVANDDDTETED